MCDYATVVKIKQIDFRCNRMPLSRWKYLSIKRFLAISAYYLLQNRTDKKIPRTQHLKKRRRNLCRSPPPPSLQSMHFGSPLSLSLSLALSQLTEAEEFHSGREREREKRKGSMFVEKEGEGGEKRKEEAMA